LEVRKDPAGRGGSSRAKREEQLPGELEVNVTVSFREDEGSPKRRVERQTTTGKKKKSKN